MKEADNYKCYKILLNKQRLRVSGLNDIPFLTYLPKHFMQVNIAQYFLRRHIGAHLHGHQHGGRKSKVGLTVRSKVGQKWAQRWAHGYTICLFIQFAVEFNFEIAGS